MSTKRRRKDDLDGGTSAPGQHAFLVRKMGKEGEYNVLNTLINENMQKQLLKCRAAWRKWRGLRNFPHLLASACMPPGFATRLAKQ